MAKRGRKSMTMAQRVRRTAERIIEGEGEISMNELLNKVMKQLAKRGFVTRSDYALTSIISTPGLEIRVARSSGKKKVKIK